MQSRAGTDALVASVRAALDVREDAVVVSLDGRSAYDSISRAAFLAKTREVAPQLLPFVRVFYGRPSTYCWWDSAGRLRDIPQGEGCEQGDPLAPALFALGQHESLASAAAALDPQRNSDLEQPSAVSSEDKDASHMWRKRQSSSRLHS